MIKWDSTQDLQEGRGLAKQLPRREASRRLCQAPEVWYVHKTAASTE